MRPHLKAVKGGFTPQISLTVPYRWDAPTVLINMLTLLRLCDSNALQSWFEQRGIRFDLFASATSPIEWAFECCNQDDRNLLVLTVSRFVGVPSALVCGHVKGAGRRRSCWLSELRFDRLTVKLVSAKAAFVRPETRS